MDIKEVIFPKEHRRMDVGRMKKDHLIHTPGDEKWPHRSKDTALFRQYKISVDILGRPLTSFNSSREFVGAIADAMKGKASFADSDRMTYFSQPINMLTSMLISFIVTSALVISKSLRRVKAS